MKGLYCVVCGAEVTVSGGMINGKGYCGKHYHPKPRKDTRPQGYSIIEGVVK